MSQKFGMQSGDHSFKSQTKKNRSFNLKNVLKQSDKTLKQSENDKSKSDKSVSDVMN
jgi:hypothetical protein